MNPDRRFLGLYALAWAGAAIAYTPFLTLLLPMHVDRLAGAGAELVTTEMVAFEWIRTAEHPEFKLLQSLFK